MSDRPMGEIFRLPLVPRFSPYGVGIGDYDACDIGSLDGVHPKDQKPVTLAAIRAINEHDGLVARNAELEAKLRDMTAERDAMRKQADLKAHAESEWRRKCAECVASRERLRITLRAVDDSELDVVTFDKMWALLYPADLEPWEGGE